MMAPTWLPNGSKIAPGGNLGRSKIC